jgi:hypothetical protein
VLCVCVMCARGAARRRRQGERLSPALHVASMSIQSTRLHTSNEDDDDRCRRQLFAAESGAWPAQQTQRQRRHDHSSATGDRWRRRGRVRMPHSLTVSLAAFVASRTSCFRQQRPHNVLACLPNFIAHHHSTPSHPTSPHREWLASSSWRSLATCGSLPSLNRSRGHR